MVGQVEELNRGQRALNLLRFKSTLRAIAKPNAIHKLLDDFSGAAWTHLELGQGSFEAHQILNRHPVTIQNVPPDFSDRQRSRTSKTPRTNRWKLRWVQKTRSSVFAWRPEAAARSLWFGFFFQPGEFIH